MRETDRPHISSALAKAIEDLVDAKLEAALAERATSAESSPWLSLEAAAKYAYVSQRTLERRIARGQLRTTCIGRRRLVHRADLDAMNAAAGRE
jgi:excisionase family DNA binding protein